MTKRSRPLARRCAYVHTDGRPCGSPPVRDGRFCYFHYQVNRPRATVPPLEDADAIQLTLTDLARAVLAETVDLKRATVLAYILQTAVSNLKHVQLGVHTDAMTTDPPPATQSTDEIDAAYSTWTPRARDDSPGDNAAADVMLTRHDIT